MEGMQPTSKGEGSKGHQTGRERRGGRAQVEERALVAAQRLFAERGLHGTTVRDIASEAGVSHALVHRYLGTKEDILVAVIRRNATPVLERARSAATAREAALSMFRELRTARPDYLKLLARVTMEGVPFEAAGHDFPALRQLIEITERQARSDPDKARELPEPRVLVAAVVALAIGWTISEDWLVQAAGLSESDPPSLEASVERILVSLFDANLPPAVRERDEQGGTTR
jgi:TetR/AcrR family transcriptional regulator, repressor for neighboring sulfatase